MPFRRIRIDFAAVLKEAKEAHLAGKLDRAGELCVSLLNASPDNFDALLLLGTLAAKTGREAVGERALNQVLAVEPDNFEALIWLGIILQRLGRFEEALIHCEHAHKLRPESFAPLVGILRSQRMAENGLGYLEVAETLLAGAQGTDDERRQLSYSVGKAFDDLADYESAMKYYDLANQLAARVQKPEGFDRKRYSERIDGVIEVFTKELFDRYAYIGAQSTKPIFIIGMVRSGTTLTEQILSRHPLVFPAGERGFWIQNGPNTFERGPFNPELASYLALQYLGMLNRLAPSAKHVTDKMPLNYLLIGLIHLLFPKAPIIHCRRNPVDTCLSIYVTPYAAPPDFAFSREDIVYGYREYIRLIDHWRQIMPEGRMLEVDYERLTSEPEPQIREMLAYCGLDWDPACLNPEQSQRRVDTPSRWQVRQPVYKSSVGRWRNYAPWLGAIAELESQA